MEKKSTQLRKLLQQDELLIIVAIGTAQEAQLAQKAGFKAVGLSGASTSAQILGLPDAGFLTMTELVENVERICRATDLPVRVDCDTGFGNAINVRRTVESVIRAGAAALFIEDQVAPKRCGFTKGKELISIDEAVGKYRAAIDVRNELDPDFIIMARCDARGAVGGSVDEVIRRGKAYLEAGVDIFYAEALQTRDEIRKVRKALPDCLFYASALAINPPLTEHEYKDLGICFANFHTFFISSIAIYDFLIDLKKRGCMAFEEFREKTQKHPLGGFGIFDLAGFPKVVEWEKKYLTPERLNKYDSSIGSYDPRVGHNS
jgi:2-methylisocitrate lyase-like PEP mutase family enzyme